jgi:hypothetical protein
VSSCATEAGSILKVPSTQYDWSDALRVSLRIRLRTALKPESLSPVIISITAVRINSTALLSGPFEFQPSVCATKQAHRPKIYSPFVCDLTPFLDTVRKCVSRLTRCQRRYEVGGPHRGT